MTIPALEGKRDLIDLLLSFAGLLGILGGIIIKKRTQNPRTPKLLARGTLVW